jgi:hypothetical protein
MPKLTNTEFVAQFLQPRSATPTPKPAEMNKQPKRKADGQAGRREDMILEEIAKLHAMAEANANEIKDVKDTLKRLEDKSDRFTETLMTLGRLVEERLTTTPSGNIEGPEPTPQPGTGHQGKTPTYAEAAGSLEDSAHNPNKQTDKDNTWIAAGKKKKAQRQQQENPKAATPKPYASTDRKIIVHLGKTPEKPNQAATEALYKVNAALTATEGFAKPPLALARISNNDNTITFTTAPYARNTDYEDKLPTIEQAIMDLQPSNSRIMQRWSKFILHGVPLSATPESVRKDIEAIYQRPMGQTPRWLINPERLNSNKTASSMVITLIGELTIKDLGVSSFSIANKVCRLERYIQYNAATHCQNCQGWGHPKEMCKNPTRCCHCSGDHHSTKHPCDTEGCKGGLRCPHPPMLCVNCHAPHKATDSACPSKAKAQAARTKGPNPTETEVVMTDE